MHRTNAHGRQLIKLASGWPADLPEAEILAWLVELNYKRTEEVKDG